MRSADLALTGGSFSLPPRFKRAPLPCQRILNVMAPRESAATNAAQDDE